MDDDEPLMFQWLREVCSTCLLQTPIVLGGGGGARCYSSN